MNDLFPIAPISNAPALKDRAQRVRDLVGVARTCIIEIGRELIEAKAEIGHGNWLPWLKEEFGWSEATAQNYMGVARAFKSPTIRDFASLTIDATALYALAAPDVPQAARDEAIERAETGEHITREAAQQMVTEAQKKAFADALAEAAKARDAAINTAVFAATERFRNDQEARDAEIKKIRDELASPDLKTIASSLCKVLKIKTLNESHYRLLAQMLGKPITVGKRTFLPIDAAELARQEEETRLAGDVTNALGSIANAAPPAALLASCYPVQRLMIRERLPAVISWVNECVLALQQYEPDEKV